MAVTDPVDARLLAALAEQGKAAVHELAAKVGMDPREVAYRLVALSGSGLPLLVGVECDPQGVRAAVAGAGGWATPNSGGPQQVQGAPSGPYTVQGAPSGAYTVQGTPSGAYTTAAGGPAGQHPQAGRPQPPMQPAPAQQQPAQRAQQFQQPPARPPMQQPQQPGPQSQPFAAQGHPGSQALPGGQPFPGGQGHPGTRGHPVGQQQAPPRPPARSDPIMSTWGPPQSASWARGDQRHPGAEPVPAGSPGRSGDVLQTQGLEGERLAIQLLEVQDPADFLFGAAGYRLDEGERAVVVHTEITNRGAIPFASLPDNYLELVATDGTAISKAPVSLSSRPPHQIGVAPGETTGGHTVYVLPEATRIVSVRWNARPEMDERSVTWSLDD